MSSFEISLPRSSFLITNNNLTLSHTSDAKFELNPKRSSRTTQVNHSSAHKIKYFKGADKAG